MITGGKKALRVPVEYTGFQCPEDECIQECSYEVEKFVKAANKNFTVSPTARLFVDYELKTKGHACGDWGKCRPLTESERIKYAPTFAKIGVSDMSKVRLVEYCWYDCSEAPDYYDDVTYSDDFYKEV